MKQGGRKHDGQPTHWIALDFKVLINPNTVANGEPHKFDDVQMFTFASMPEELHSQLPKFLALYKAKLW